MKNIIHNGEIYDTRTKLESISCLTERREKTICEMESEEEGAIAAAQVFSEGSTERRDIGHTSSEEVTVVSQSVDGSGGDEKVFNLNASLEVLESDQLDAEFDDALVEMEGNKSFPCPSCEKICKSKGGLTRHANAKHAEESPSTLPVESDMTILSIENLSEIIEAIKTRLVADDLYGVEINNFIKNASCSKALFDDVLPLYTKFCRKKNHDKLLEQFYSLLPNASKYLNCTNSNAANIIMIELPDHLVGHYKLGQERGRGESEQAKTKPTGDIKLDPRENDPLSYVAGFVLSKLFQKYKRTHTKPNEELQKLLQSLKSTEVENSFIQARRRSCYCL